MTDIQTLQETIDMHIQTIKTLDIAYARLQEAYIQLDKACGRKT